MESSPPVRLSGTDCWAAISKEAAKRAMKLEIAPDGPFWSAWLRAINGPPGGVPAGHPGLTKRVVAAVAKARLTPHRARPITDDDGPHLHHWQPILWWCRGCGACDEG